MYVTPQHATVATIDWTVSHLQAVIMRSMATFSSWAVNDSSPVSVLTAFVSSVWQRRMWRITRCVKDKSLGLKLQFIDNFPMSGALGHTYCLVVKITKNVLHVHYISSIILTSFFVSFPWRDTSTNDKLTSRNFGLSTWKCSIVKFAISTWSGDVSSW